MIAMAEIKMDARIIDQKRLIKGAVAEYWQLGEKIFPFQRIYQQDITGRTQFAVDQPGIAHHLIFSLPGQESSTGFRKGIRQLISISQQVDHLYESSKIQWIETRRACNFSSGHSSQTKMMTLGVFHFAYHNLDAVKTVDQDKISVLEEPFQSEIVAISEAIAEYKPTIIAIEVTPDKQSAMDSLYSLYKNHQFDLKKDEIYQLGFRIGRYFNLPQIHCVNDWGRHYESIDQIFKDSTRAAKFEQYYLNSPDSVYQTPGSSKRVSSIIDELLVLNDPDQIKDRLSVYLLNPFKYEEEPGDFTGVDFETGRWFSRNLRIFRNIQRIPHDANDRILLIIGREHLNLLNPFFEVSKEFEFVSPLPYLKNAKLN